MRPEITTCDIYRAIMAFVAMQLIARVLVSAFTRARHLAAEGDRLVTALGTSSNRYFIFMPPMSGMA